MTDKENMKDVMKTALSGEVPELKHVETVVRKPTMTMVLHCPGCKKEIPFPTHCGEPMELEDNVFKCTNPECRETTQVPTCCGDSMKIAVKQL